MRILSASFANEDNTAVVIMTEERGNILISLKDRPDLWNEYIASGVATTAYVPENPDAAMDGDIATIFNNGGFASALCRVMLSEINILRQALQLQPRTPQQFLTAIQNRKKN